MLCLVKIHWSQSWGPKVHGGPQPPDWGWGCAPLLRRLCIMASQMKFLLGVIGYVGLVILCWFYAKKLLI